MEEVIFYVNICFVLSSLGNCDAGKKPIKHDFSFDQVFPPNARQTDIFELVSPLVQSALDGYNICIFAYGQTGNLVYSNYNYICSKSIDN